MAVRKLVVVWSAILVALVGSPRGSLAQPAPTPSERSPSEAAPGPPAEAAPAPAAPPPVGRRLDETTAFALSLGGTLGAWTMFGLGVRDSVRAEFPQVWVAGLIGAVLAPSFGHWYRGKILTRGLRVRAAGAALTFLTVGRAVTCEDGCDGTVLAALVFGGLALYVIGTADDIITAPSEVRKHNERLQILGLTPTVSSQSAGVAVAGRF